MKVMDNGKLFLRLGRVDETTRKLRGSKFGKLTDRRLSVIWAPGISIIKVK